MMIFAFTAGCAIALPVAHLLLPFFVLSYLIWLYPLKPILFFCLAGILVTLCHHWLSSPKGLPDQSTMRKVNVYGEIMQLPKRHEGRLTIQLKVSKLNGHGIKVTMRLTCYKDCPNLHVGDLITLKANIKKPHDYHNPGVFSFEDWTKANHIHRIGSFQARSLSILGNSRKRFLGTLRNYLYEGIQQLALNQDAKALISALTIGVSDDIKPRLWQQFRHTGTAHLMVISGAHVGLITGLCFFICRLFWCSIPRLSLYVPAQRVAAYGALIIAFLYALIAGFAIPSQRSIIMSAIVLSRYLSNQYHSQWQAWQYALFFCVLLEPHSLVMPGFYLSFMAVAILMLVSQRYNYPSIVSIIVLQIGCLLGLMPLTLYLFHYQANNGLIANLICIPFVSLLLLPFALLKVLLIPLGMGDIGNWFFNHLVDTLIYILTFFDSYSWLNWQFALQSIVQVCLILCGLLILFIVSNRYLMIPAVILVIIAFIPKTIEPKSNQAKIHVLDVGQGLAILISTKHHHLLYDTGLKFYGGGDIGERVIIPFLEYFNIRQIDAIVVSHPDIDHRGGLNTVSQSYPSALLISDAPGFYRRGKNCHSYPIWHWDGIQFEFLPLTPFKHNKNNHSCVLKISSPSRSILLTGDIEQEAENYLVNHVNSKLRSNILISPHHGSKTSSTIEFIHAVSPSMVIISSGLDNQYHFPHKQVVNRMLNEGIIIKNTAVHGMVELTI